MNKDIKVSVIIAAYNAEMYLEEALNSIILQTMDDNDYEIIVVDDGSKDRTAEILDQYAQEHANMKVIHKENGGPSDARNVGLTVAKGKYLYFFDADDVVLPESLTVMYREIEEQNADLVIGKYNFFDNIRIRPIQNLDDVIEKGVIDRYDKDLLWTFSLWNKMFRRDIVEENHIRFPNVSYSEDGVFYLKYLYQCKKIIGLDTYILNYRKSSVLNPNAITASISPKKINDYIKAHCMMMESIKESFLKDHPEESNIKNLMEKNETIREYIAAFYCKEVQILLDHFYSQFWKIPRETRELIVKEAENCFENLSMKEMFQLSEFFFEYSLYNIPVTPEEALEQSVFTICLYGAEDSKDKFLKCLSSLEEQNLIFIHILLPEHMKQIIEDEDMMRDNLSFIPCSSERELFLYTKNHAKTEYTIFADSNLIYFSRGLRYELGKLKASLNDFVSGVVYHQDYDEPQPTIASKIASDSIINCFRYNEDLNFDSLLGNKYFKTEFIQSLDIDFTEDIFEIQKIIYGKGYFNHRYSKGLIFDGSEEEYTSYVTKPETKEYNERKFIEKGVDLKDPQYQYDFVRSSNRYCDYDRGEKEARFLKLYHLILSKLPLKKQVAFLSIRKDNALDTNAEALYKSLKCKKTFYSKKLPHSFSDILKMVYLMTRSKVIVTDDYVKYMRYFPLRPDQRVIQLWHACGAFKKFGIRGTNVAYDVDRATHARYNLVCVSGYNVRQIYADAFDLTFEKVRALGVPRTDYFFDEEYINEKRQKIYKKYPIFEEKKVIIYAPTFREVNADRAVFRPEIDFEKLSKELKEDQIFVICPHPLMKNAIVDKDYDNIKVIRDFSTNDMMFISDAMITDYSSVIFEYALLRKPMAFFCYDLKIYNRGFYMKYPDDLPGDIYETQEELMQFIRNIGENQKQDKLDTFIEKYMSSCDGHSSERIAKIIEQYIR